MIGSQRKRRKFLGKRGINKKNWLIWKMREAPELRRKARAGR